MKSLFTKVLLVNLLMACGQEAQVPDNRTGPVVVEPAGTSTPAPKATPTQTTVVRKKKKSSGSTTPAPTPTPECVVDVDCGEGFQCTDGSCEEVIVLVPPPPECAEDNPCANADQHCEEGSCVFNACIDDSECSSASLCDEGFCRTKTCPALADAIDPESLVVSPEGTGTTEEEIQADIDFTISQLELAYPDLSIIAENIKACEIEDQVPAHQAQFDALDAVRIELDNHLASQLQRLNELQGE